MFATRTAVLARSLFIRPATSQIVAQRFLSTTPDMKVDPTQKKAVRLGQLADV